MTKTQLMILCAFRRGYRMEENGVLISPTGGSRKIAIYGKAKYPTFTISVNGRAYGIPIHQFAAYCFYGLIAFDAECTRHKNSNVLDCSRANILIGTHRENSLDKSSLVRINAAKKARAAQGRRPNNALFSDEQIKQIRSSPESLVSLANIFGVTRQAIWLIKNRKNYSDVN